MVYQLPQRAFGSLVFLASIVFTLTSLTVDLSAQSLHLNEIVSSNSSIIADEDGDYEDWIEIYNSGVVSVNLDGFGLSDSYNNPFKWVFPEVFIEPGEFLLVWASNKDRREPGQPLHTNFAISSGGEEILITDPDGVRIDELDAVVIPTNFSIGRKPDGFGDWVFFKDPTPGESNTTEGYFGFLDDVTFSHDPGFYTESFDLVLSHPDPDVIIYYTLDGSTPTENSLVYDGPITMYDRSSDPNVFSIIPTNKITVGMRAWAPPNNLISKSNTVRAIAHKLSFLSEVKTRTFFVYPEGAARYYLPIFSLVTDPENLFSDETGIYVPGNSWSGGDDTGNYYQRGDEWERSVSLELFEEDGTLVISQSVGIRIHGGVTRRFPQKSLRIYARNEYGNNTINYRLFPELEYDSFRRFILRPSGNDLGFTMFRDATAQSLVSHFEIDTQAYRPSILFINGEYWGIQNIRERYDRHYLERVYGIDPDNIDYLSNNQLVSEGSAAHYNDMMSFIAANSLSLDENYIDLKTRMDVDNFLDYYTAQIYCANTDWPHNNIDYWRLRVPFEPNAPTGHDGRWRWLLFDVDRCLGYTTNSNTNMISYLTLTHWSTLLFRSLLGNDSFKYDFINRLNDNLNTTFIPIRVLAVIDSLKPAVQDHIVEHISRWNQPSNFNNWNNRVNVMKDFANMRPANLRAHIRDHFGIDNDFTITFNVSGSEHGYVRTNNISITSEQPGVGPDPYPWSGLFFEGIPTQISAVPRVGYQFMGWSGDIVSSEETITVIPDQNLSLTANFEPIPAPVEPSLVHYWNFNDNTTLSSLLSPNIGIVPGSSITHIQGGTSEIDVAGGSGQNFNVENLNARNGDPSGTHLRFNNPIGGVLVFAMPTSGFENVVIRYATRRSGQGAGNQLISYTVNGDDYIFFATQPVFNANPALIELDFSDVEDVADNPAFAIKFEFELGGGGEGGNNRFDNVTLEGTAKPGVNTPPVIDEIPDLITFYISDTAAQVDLNSIFSDPDNDALTFTASSGNELILTATVQDDILLLNGLRPGDAQVTVTADDGNNPGVSTSFRVLVYPSPFAVADNEYRFTSFDAQSPDYTYPDNMMFLQSDVNDPGLNTPLLFPYFIVDEEYAASDLPVGFPYKNQSRTRINGLGDDGISFINTGRGRDVGGALLALNTVGASNVRVDWLAGTRNVNSRIYALRLQYRTSLEDAFEDFLVDGEPVEYTRNATAGHTQNFGPIYLPENLLEQANLQLLWRYYYISGSGARPEIRLDNIIVRNEPDEYVIDINGVLYDNKHWRMMTNFVEGATYRDLFGGIWTQGFAGSNFPNASSSIRYFDEESNSFVSINSLDDEMGVGKGFIITFFEDDDPGVSNIVGGFPKTLSLQGFSSVNRKVTLQKTTSGWNLLGNPFSRGFRAFDFVSSRDELANIVYTWNAEANTFDSWNGIAGALTDGVIGRFQGYFVERLTEGSDIVEKRFSYETENRSLQKTVEPFSIRLDVSNDDVSASAFISFTDDGQIGRDAWDAWQLYPLLTNQNSRSIMLYSAIESLPFDINNLPLDLEETLEFPLHVDLIGNHSANEFYLSWQLTGQLPENWQIQLIDTKTGAVSDMGSDSDVDFILNTSLNKSAITIPDNMVVQNDQSSRFMIRVNPSMNLVSNDVGSELPQVLSLRQNYPNPFNPTTSIHFELPESGFADLSIYNMVGQRVATLVREDKSAGVHTVTFDASTLSSGVYIYQLRFGGEILTRKMTLIK